MSVQNKLLIIKTQLKYWILLVILRIYVLYPNTWIKTKQFNVPFNIHFWLKIWPPLLTDTGAFLPREL